MKKLITALLVAFTLVQGGQAISALDNLNTVQLKINGELVKTDTPPVILAGRTLVPVRGVFEKLGAKVDWNGIDKSVLVCFNDTNIKLKINDNNAQVNDKTVRMDVGPTIINNRTMVPIRFISENLKMQVGWFPNEQMVSVDDRQAEPARLTDITYNSTDSLDQVVINFDNYHGHTIIPLSNPSRLVIDFSNSKLDTMKYKTDVGSSMLKAIRSGQYAESTARIVLDVSSDIQYKDVLMSDKLILKLLPRQGQEPSRGGDVRGNEGHAVYDSQGGDGTQYSLGKVSYIYKGDRASLLLDGIALTHGEENLIADYVEKYDEASKSYTITFKQGYDAIKPGTLNINDSMIKNIKVTKNDSTNETSITFSGTDDFTYFTIYRPDTDDTAITVLKTASKSDRLVVIDPGHGGVEVGAVYGGVDEKDLNLAISLKLNNILRSKGVKTYIMRSDDSFVGLYERAYIANTLNAGLFLCIHNNAFMAESAGTETLYFPPILNDGSFNGLEFAKAIQNRLVAKLGTVNRGVIERPNLVVLRATTMTSALAEIGFMTNADELEKLKSDEFQQKAAEAMADAVIEGLNH